jgi:hypothetical protein
MSKKAKLFFVVVVVVIFNNNKKYNKNEIRTSPNNTKVIICTKMK